MSAAQSPLVVLTAHVSYAGPDRVDVTRASGSPFGPSWDLLRPQLELRQTGLEDDESWQRYADAYRAEMRRLWVDSQPLWQQLMARRRAVLCCCCDLSKHPGRCHRLVLAECLRAVGAVYLGEHGDWSEPWHADRQLAWGPGPTGEIRSACGEYVVRGCNAWLCLEGYSHLGSAFDSEEAKSVCERDLLERQRRGERC